MRPEPEQYRAWADAAARALQRWYDPRTGLWKTTGWWNCANALTALIQHSQRTGERRYLSVIETTFGRAQRVNPEFSNEFYDDDGWWALAWIAAFDLIGDEKYLDVTRKLFAGMASGWDDTCGGGLCWTRGKTYKNAIANELFLLTAGLLHQRTTGPGRRASGYLDWALREWQWFNASGLIGPAGLVNDGLTADCTNNGGTTWTYNQGVIIGGLTALYDITGDGAYLGQAEAIAVAALRDLTMPPGILADPGERPGKPGRSVGAAWSGKQSDQPQFKGIFIKNLYYLYQADNKQAYKDFIIKNAAAILRHDRDGSNNFGLHWDGPFDKSQPNRQSSAMDTLNAAMVL